LQVIRNLRTDDVADFECDYYSLRSAVCAPKPSQRPRLPIWIGGGEKRILRIAARFATGANFAAPGIGSGGDMDHFTYFKHKKSVLESHCRDIGRDPNEIVLSAGVNLMFWGRERDEVRSRLERAANERKLSVPERERLLAGMGNGIGSVEACIEHVRRFVELGARSISMTRASPKGIKRFAEEVGAEPLSKLNRPTVAAPRRAIRRGTEEEEIMSTWDQILAERDRAVFGEAGYGQRIGFGVRPALVVIDVNYAFVGLRAPIMESIVKWPQSTGEGA